MAMTTGTTSGCTSSNNCFVIIPDMNATYTFKILLKSEVRDLGFFDVKNNFNYGYYSSNYDEYYIGIGEDLLN